MGKVRKMGVAAAAAGKTDLQGSLQDQAQEAGRIIGGQRKRVPLGKAPV